MRPWTLNSDNATEHTPLLLNLCKVSHDVVAKPIPIVASDPKPLRRIRGEQNVGHETTAKFPEQSIASSYSITWNHYIHGHVVSRSSRRFIMNLLSATAARVIERHESSDEDSDVSDIERCKTHAGSLDLIHETLQGIAAKDEENGALSFGRHATSIKMGRDMWETPELTSVEKRQAQEIFFGGSAWPKTSDMSQPWPDTDVATKTARETMKLDEKRPMLKIYSSKMNDYVSY